MLDKLTINDIENKEQKAIADTIGIEAYISLVRQYGGTSIYVLKEDSLVKDIRDKMIREEFDGGNYVYLAKKYNLSETSIRNITNNNFTNKYQISFDDLKNT
ncbi:MAG: DNA-binding protein [Peptostreptococcaceae bacterium]|nr:DNA-binding protein [Peptostreptococcaceae bacterium]